jgi:transposase
MSEITTIGLDLAKTVFQLHWAEASGRAVRRGWVLEVLAGLSRCTVAMGSRFNAD